MKSVNTLNRYATTSMHASDAQPWVLKKFNDIGQEIINSMTKKFILFYHFYKYKNAFVVKIFK